MTAALLSSGSSFERLLLLLALIAAVLPTSADYVTWQRCKQRGRRERVRLYPVDNDADWLNVAMCRLTDDIRPGDFDGLPNLTVIYFQYNDVAHVDSAAFRAVPKLTRLDLTYNKLTELPVFDEQACPSLTELYLWNNQITGISNSKTFSGCVKLQHLSLSHNHIDYLHPDLFSTLTDLRQLYLNNNKIKSIPDQLFINNNKLERLNLMENEISYLPANFVSNLKRAGVGLTVFYFHDNPYQCACLLELLEEVKRAGVVDYSPYNGTETRCSRDGNSIDSCIRTIRTTGSTATTASP